MTVCRYFSWYSDHSDHLSGGVRFSPWTSSKSLQLIVKKRSMSSFIHCTQICTVTSYCYTIIVEVYLSLHLCIALFLPNLSSLFLLYDRQYVSYTSLLNHSDIMTTLEVTIARELLPHDLHLDHINYLLTTKGPTDVDIVQILHLSNSFESKHWFTGTANQLNSVRYSVGTLYFTKYESQS